MPKFTSSLRSPLNLSGAELQQWRTCFHAHGDRTSPFLSDTFVRAVASVRPRVYVAAIQDGGRPVAFLPFQFRNAISERLGIAEPAGEYMSGYFGLIADPAFTIEPKQLLRLCRLSYMNVTYLEESQLEHGLGAQRSSNGCLIRLDEGPEEYWRQLAQKDKKLLSELGRRQRQIQARYGELRFDAEVKDWGEPLDHLIEFKRAQYKRTGKPDLLATSWKRRLLYTLAGLQEPSCRGVLSTLYAGDTWVASHFGIRNQESLNYYFPVYNPALGRFSPGHLLLKAIIDSSVQTGLKLIDRGAGDSPAKREFANDVHLLYSGAWYRTGFRSLVYRAACSVKWRLRSLAAASDV